jgi:hypothetical protein
MADQNDRLQWEDEDEYWQTNYRSRPYASSEGRQYDYYQPGYRYGYEAANRYRDRDWDDVESDLEKDWNGYQYRGTSTWQQMKAAVRDAWDRVTGKHPVSNRR